MNKLIGAVLIILSLVMGYIGINKIADSTGSVNILGIKIEASDESGKQQGILLIGGAVILFFGGIYTLNKK